MGRQACRVLVFAACCALLQPVAFAQDTAKGRTLSFGYRFVQTSGEELFANICQGCHMPDGAGATGAGSYPPLAVNPNLESGAYPISLVLNGRRAMPPFGDRLSDEQIAAVVNYIRTHFGNDYRDQVTAREVQDARRKGDQK